MQCIFQDPFSSLNPRMTAGENITYAIRVHKLAQKNECEQLAKDLLNLVGLQQSDSRKLPHAFSGGERQRIGIARALALRPDFIFCDEPTSSLDVSVQAQILSLLKDLQKEHKLGYLFITHNISVVEYIAHYVAVMYQGKIVEQGKVEEVLKNPKNAYTTKLLSAVPHIEFNK